MPRKPTSRNPKRPKHRGPQRGIPKKNGPPQRDEFGRFVKRGTPYTFGRRSQRFTTSQYGGALFTHRFYWTIPLDNSEVGELHRVIGERVKLGRRLKHRLGQVRLLIQTMGRIYETVFGPTDEKALQWFGSKIWELSVKNLKAGLSQILARVEDRTIDQGRAAWAVSFYVATFKLLPNPVEFKYQKKKVRRI